MSVVARSGSSVRFSLMLHKNCTVAHSSRPLPAHFHFTSAFWCPLGTIRVISGSRNIAFGILIANLFKSTIRGLGQSPPRLDVYSSIHDKNGSQFRWFLSRFSFPPKYPPPPCRLVSQCSKRRPALIRRLPLCQYGPRGETSHRHHT